MGKDNLFHKRKGRSEQSFKRSVSRRAPYDVVLIICEGEKTEPQYFRDLCSDLQLHTANIEVIGLGTDPFKLIEHAEKKYNCSPDYNRIYCIFDKDQHSNYCQAKTKIDLLSNDPENPIPIYGIYSVPCFEYWLLLHYCESSSPFNSKPKQSAANNLISQLKKHIPQYAKAKIGIFEITKPHLDKAIKSAKKIYQQQIDNGTDNPSTNMFELIEYLKNIKK